MNKVFLFVFVLVILAGCADHSRNFDIEITVENIPMPVDSEGITPVAPIISFRIDALVEKAANTEESKVTTEGELKASIPLVP